MELWPGEGSGERAEPVGNRAKIALKACWNVLHEPFASLSRGDWLFLEMMYFCTGETPVPRRGSDRDGCGWGGTWIPLALGSGVEGCLCVESTSHGLVAHVTGAVFWSAILVRSADPTRCHGRAYSDVKEPGAYAYQKPSHPYPPDCAELNRTAQRGSGYSKFPWGKWRQKSAGLLQGRNDPCCADGCHGGNGSWAMGGNGPPPRLSVNWKDLANENGADDRVVRPGSWDGG